MLPQGTAGVVALDTDVCTAAVTSTGRKKHKFIGRIGDATFMGSGSRQKSGRFLKEALRRQRGGYLR
jgi:isoaspartyl peptidase/L-asparaginase-like protein (Ntn-hydrolase superfamily)